MTLALDRSTIEVRPLTGYTGAEIFGVDLAKELEVKTIAEIRAALLQWGVVFFRDQEMTPEQQIAFAAQFGDVTPAHPTLPGLDGYPEIMVVADRKRTREAQSAAPKTSVSEYDEYNWHVDLTFVPNPPFASILRGLVTPPYGGDTGFANLAVAYETLSKPIRDLIDGLHAVHENALPPNTLSKMATGKAHHSKDAFESKLYRTVHPVVRVHPETGERVIYVNVNFTQRIVELSYFESQALLNFLYSHIAQNAFIAKFRWQPNSIAFWDNRKVAHIAPGDLGHLDFDRVMHRVTLVGDVPVGPDGFRSEALEGDEYR
jgi:alpha-ketoglutarate-dependent taurine dioxygenase